MKRIVLFVEGEGDVLAMPALLGRWLVEQSTEHQLAAFIDSKPFRVKGSYNLTGQAAEKWTNFIRAACKRANFGGILLMLDADNLEDYGKCVRDVARELAAAAKTVGAGTVFSVAVVFFRQEFESFAIACHHLLPGLDLKKGGSIPADVEIAPRGAKGWLNANLKDGYSTTGDQADISRHIDFPHLRQIKNRSFQRLENAMTQLLNAIATGQHVATPSSPDSPELAAP